MGFRINRGIFQYKDTASDTFINKFKIDDRGDMIEVDADGNKITTYMRLGDKSHDADLLDGVDSSGFVKTTNNSTLNTDTRNTRGATRLFRNDSNSDYSVQHYWTGAHWFLRGYVGDTFHAEVRVGKADSADNATNASYLTGGDTSFRGLLYHNLNGDLNNYNVAGLYSAEYVGSTNIPLDQRGHFIQISDAGGTDVKTQWYYQSNGEKIHMRLMWGNQNWKEWRELITDSNIGSQSVNYASSAGNADTIDGYHATNAGGGIPVLNANGYWDAPSWINVRGTGLYSSTANGAHFVPNPHSYGSWQITGSRNGWYGIHFGGGNGVALMMNETESGIYRQNSGWKFRHQNGKFYVYTGTNGGGTGYGVWHEGNDGSGSGLDADKLDGYHSNQLGNRDFTKQGFYVDGDENTYYPVVIGNGTGRYGFNRYSITRHYSSTAPWDPIGTGNHKGGLTFDFYWSGDTNWGGNHKPFRVHEFGENYTTMVGGIALARTGGMVVWLRGGHAYYELHCDALPPTITVYLEGFTDGSGGVYDPTDDVNQHKDTIWNNWPVRNGSSLYIGNRAVATEQWTDDTFLRTTEKAADSNLLDGIDSSSFLRSDANDSYNGDLQVNGMFFKDGSNVNRNFKMQSNDSSGSDTGISMYNAAGTHTLQLYGTANQYGFLDGNWASWDIRKTKNGAFEVDEGSGLKRVWNEGNFDPATKEAAGAADAVNLRIEEEILPAIDGKLGSTAKAADSNLLDGLDSLRFLYTTTGQFSGDWNTLTDSDQEIRLVEVHNITGGAHSNHPTGLYTYGSVLGWQLDSATFKLYSSHTGDLAFQTGWNNDGYSGWRTIWHSANFNPATKSDTSHNHSTIYAGHGYINSGDWNTYSSPHGSDGSFGGGIYRVESNAANPPASGVYNWSLYQQGNTSRGSQIAVGAYAGGNRLYFRGSNQNANAYRNWAEVWHTDNFDPATKANVSHDHNDLYYTKAQSNASYDSAGSASTAQTNATNAANDRIDNEVMPQVTTNATNIARNATDIATKLGTTGKAADSEAVDGVDSSRIVYGANERRSTRNDGVGIVSPNQNSGFYYGYNPPGAPHTEWWNWLTVAGASWTGGNNYDFKLAHNFHADDFYVSRMHNGTQEDWRKIIDSGNIGSQTVANAGYATNAGNADLIDGVAFRNTGSNQGINANTIASNGITYYNSNVPNFTGNSTDGALYSQAYSSAWQHQIAGDYRSGQLAVRGKNNNSWQPWRTVLDSSNFTSFIPAATAPVQATVEGGNDSTLVSIAFSPGEGAATFTLADGQSFRLAFAR